MPRVTKEAREFVERLQRMTGVEGRYLRHGQSHPIFLFGGIEVPVPNKPKGYKNGLVKHIANRIKKGG